jgi:hypothetical protein
VRDRGHLLEPPGLNLMSTDITEIPEQFISWNHQTGQKSENAFLDSSWCRFCAGKCCVYLWMLLGQQVSCLLHVANSMTGRAKIVMPPHIVNVPRNQSGAVPISSLLGVGSWGPGKLERVGQLGEGWGK